MLINCPRCGFQQPKDQYCAQCGVDIETFIPTQTPFFMKVFRNPLFQFSVLFIALAGAGGYFYKTQDHTPAPPRISQTRADIPVASSFAETGATVAEPSAPSEAPTEQAESASLTAANESSKTALPTETDESLAQPHVEGSATTQTANAKATSPEADSQGRDMASSGVPHLIVTYAEVTRSALTTLMNASRNTGQFMSLVDYSAGILPGVQTALKGPGITVLRKEERSLETNRSFTWFLGAKDPQDPAQELGMTTFFEISEIDQNLLRGNLEILRSWKEPGFGAEAQKKAFPAAFEITSENGFFMAGILPPQSRINGESELTSIDVYKILNSPRFKANESELVIFFQFQRAR